MIEPVTQFPDARRKLLLVAAGWLLLFIAAVFAYWPGLAGPFLLDDFGSIADLGDRGGVRDWSTFKAFVFGGHAGTLGRPISLLSFLIDGTNWPTDPWPFKRTNLLIHLLNGGLVGLLAARILRLLDFDRQDARWIALVSAACWMLHPFLVSTTLYAVQRMAQLSTLFVFTGLVAYLYGRSFIVTRPLKAYAVMSLSVGLFTLLAIFSKENGILLPLLIGVLEITIFASQQSRVGLPNRYWSALFIVVPSAFVLLYLGDRVLRNDFFDIVPPRDYSAYESLLTQARVLVDYVRHWFIPELYTTGVFQDHFLKSTGILSPVTTLLAALLHTALITVSLVKRREWPLFAFAVLFFYGGHLLESSVLNLELYFEHRNYMAAAFLFLPLVVLLRSRVSQPMFFGVAIAALLVLGNFTRYSATVWQDFPSIVEASARKAPTSARAQAQYATQLFNAGRYDESLQVIDRAVENIDSEHPLLLVNRAIIHCQLGVLSTSEFDKLADVTTNRFYDVRSLKLYTSLTESIGMGKCPEISLARLRTMFEEMLLLPVNSDPRSLSYSQIHYFIGLASVKAGDSPQAVAAFEESLRARPGASHAMIMAALLATSEYYEEALHFSDIAMSQLEVEDQGILGRARVTENDIHHFRKVVRADIEALRIGTQDTTAE
jgi:tetratricopeptide (TPR) repeat protein